MGLRRGYAWGFRIPQLYPPPRVQFLERLIARRAESTPTCPSGLRPSGSQSPPPCRIPFSDGSIFPLRSRHTMAFSRMDVVASLGALLRWSRPSCASLWLWIGKWRRARHELCSFVAGCDGKHRGVSKRNRFDCSQQFRFWRLRFFESLPIEIFQISFFADLVFCGSHSDR